MSHQPSCQNHSGTPCACKSGDLAPPFVGSVLESLSCGLVVFDSTLRIVFSNQRARAILEDGHDLSAALSAILIDSRYLDWTMEMRRVIHSGRTMRLDAKLASRKDQPEVYLDITLSPLHDQKQSEAIGGLLLLENVSSRISMERRLAVSERLAAVGNMAARVAHEVNNPLDGILRYVNLALRHVDPAADTRTADYLEKIRTGINRMSQIIASLLEFSRTTPNKFEQATINKIVEDALAAMEGRIEENTISVVCHFKRDDMPVSSGSSLFQVYCNLIKNAVDAMPDGGTLTITTDVADSDIIVTVDDTGIGLPQEIERIFEPFFTTKPPGKGTGLGLAVCKDLIERHGGSITAMRMEPRGTRMLVRVPASNFVTPSTARPSEKNSKAQKRKASPETSTILSGSTKKQSRPHPGE